MNQGKQDLLAEHLDRLRGLGVQTEVTANGVWFEPVAYDRAKPYPGFFTTTGVFEYLLEAIEEKG